MPSDAKQPQTGSRWHLNQPDSVQPLISRQPLSTPASEPLWDHSAHIIDFVKAVVEDKGSRDVGSETSEVFSSLRTLVQILEGPADVRSLSFLESKVAKFQADPPMPPLEAIVAVLRWAKGSW